MRPNCAIAVRAAAGGRTISDAKLRAIDDAILGTMRELARRDRQRWIGLTRDQRMAEALAKAMEDVQAAAALKEHQAGLGRTRAAGARGAVRNFLNAVEPTATTTFFATVAVLPAFVAMSSPRRLKPRAPLQHRRQVAPHVRHVQAGAPMVAAAARPVVPAVGATHPVIALPIPDHQPLGQLLRVGLRPAPAQQPGAPIKKVNDVGICPGYCRQIGVAYRCALHAVTLRILRILRRPACLLASWPDFGFANACESLRIRAGLNVGVGCIRRNSQPFADCQCRRRPAWMLTIRRIRSFRRG